MAATPRAADSSYIFTSAIMMFKMVMLKDVFPILVFLVALRLLKSQFAQWMIESIVTVRHLRAVSVCTAFPRQS